MRALNYHYYFADDRTYKILLRKIDLNLKTQSIPNFVFERLRPQIVTGLEGLILSATKSIASQYEQQFNPVRKSMLEQINKEFN